MFMGLDPQMIWHIVASSLPVGGSRTLQCGIRAWLQRGPKWAMTDKIAETGFLLPSSNQKLWQENSENFLSTRTIGPSEDLVTRSSNVVGT